MPTFLSLFDLKNAHSAGFESYDPGSVAFVSNGLEFNGVVGFVEPQEKDRVFPAGCIALSAFCEATVQQQPFVARGNGGSGLVVLKPKKNYQPAVLQSLAAYINVAIRWRFSWSRQLSIDRIKNVWLPEPATLPLPQPLTMALGDAKPGAITAPTKVHAFALDELFELAAGEYHNTSALPPGRIPLVSCGQADNGIVAYVSVPASATHERQLTVSFNGMNTLTCAFHGYRFAAKDDVAVLRGRERYEPETLFYIQLMLNRERWRYSYYRKCFMAKLKRFRIELPGVESRVDQEIIRQVVTAAPYWPMIRKDYYAAKESERDQVKSLEPEIKAEESAPSTTRDAFMRDLKKVVGTKPPSDDRAKSRGQSSSKKP